MAGSGAEDALEAGGDCGAGRAGDGVLDGKGTCSWLRRLASPKAITGYDGAGYLLIKDVIMRDNQGGLAFKSMAPSILEVAENRYTNRASRRGNADRHAKLLQTRATTMRVESKL